MRKLLAAMKISVDGKTEGPEGYADWVEGWSEDNAIYLTGGATMTASLIDAGLVDEMHFITYPLLVGPGAALLQQLGRRHKLQTLDMRPLSDGRFSTSYAIA